MRNPPYPVVLKPYGQALVRLAQNREDVVCLGADLTRQTETDLFRDQIPERFFNAGMSEANLVGLAGGLARTGRTVFVNTFGTFATRRCFDQLAMSVAWPNLNVKVIGFMPGLSSPGGPSHQAIDDVALTRALPNFRVIDLADASEVDQVVQLAADTAGPVYIRLKRGEVPLIFSEDHVLDLDHANVIATGGPAVLIASGMMLPAVLSAASVLEDCGQAPTVIYVPVIKPLDASTIVRESRGAGVVVTAENHSVIGGLGSAVAEALAESGVGARLRRVGVQDVFAESGSREYLFRKYGLSQQAVIDAVWNGLDLAGTPPQADEIAATEGTYAPV